ncbi:hypothetical protein HPO96_33715 [Kribbella sandramycini]|uniref:Drug/metabolite transporter (DMT)-like permease n=1 Tax=Kribbella sandramycini TaxID=60450 RepID=A0A7Y4L6F3_9ACTN|nr:drug/metabolite transporter (DMT)-like permease [Kribbella sandramycini]NOL45217.1 hypothetical protein [Kribbella sandramycini]
MQIRPISKRGLAVWLVALLLGAFVVLPFAATGTASAANVVHQVADPSPTPTNPPGSADGDPDDYTGTSLVPIAAGVVVVLVIALSLFVFKDRFGRRKPAQEDT